jgi:hypothetical protein
MTQKMIGKGGKKRKKSKGQNDSSELRPLTHLSAWVGFCTSISQQGGKFQLRLKRKKYLEVSLNIQWKISDVKVLAHFGLSQRYCPGL